MIYTAKELRQKTLAITDGTSGDVLFSEILEDCGGLRDELRSIDCDKTALENVSDKDLMLMFDDAYSQKENEAYKDALWEMKNKIEENKDKIWIANIQYEGYIAGANAFRSRNEAVKWAAETSEKLFKNSGVKRRTREQIISDLSKTNECDGVSEEWFIKITESTLED